MHTVLFCSKDFKVLEAFEEGLQKYYGIDEMVQLDFTAEPENAAQYIDKWVANNTKHKSVFFLWIK